MVRNEVSHTERWKLPYLGQGCPCVTQQAADQQYPGKMGAAAGLRLVQRNEDVNSAANDHVTAGFSVSWERIIKLLPSWQHYGMLSAMSHESVRVQGVLH